MTRRVLAVVVTGSVCMWAGGVGGASAATDEEMAEIVLFSNVYGQGGFFRGILEAAGDIEEIDQVEEAVNVLRVVAVVPWGGQFVVKIWEPESGSWRLHAQAIMENEELGRYEKGDAWERDLAPGEICTLLELAGGGKLAELVGETRRLARCEGDECGGTPLDVVMWLVEGQIQGEYGMADAVYLDEDVVEVASYVAGLAGIDPQLWIGADDPTRGPNCAPGVAE